MIKIGKISTKIHEVGKIKAIFGLGMTPIIPYKAIKSLIKLWLYKVANDCLTAVYIVWII